MNIISRTISSAFLLFIGFSLGFNSLKEKMIRWPLLFFSVVMIILGIIILFNKKEDEIEKIKIQNLKNKEKSKKRK